MLSSNKGRYDSGVIPSDFFCCWLTFYCFVIEKLLHAPETVPFRLTRNVVDGMGPCGVEGTFSRAAEETTRILRENASALLTILSAVVADPLYKWSISPVEARRRQASKDEDMTAGPRIVGEKEINGLTEVQSREAQSKAGAKAIAKIHEKLQGYEDSTAGEQQGVEGQVQLLINSARDPDNLCLLYPGWEPWT